MKADIFSHELSTDELASLRRVLEPLRHWLQREHGRRGRIEGAWGMAGVAIGLTGLCLFDVSPLVAVVHIVLALFAGGLRADVVASRDDGVPARPFASPLHALGFVESVIEAFRHARGDAHGLQVDARCLPQAEVAAVTGVAVTSAASHPVQRTRLPPLRYALFFVCGVMALFLVPLAEAAVSLFDRRDWITLIALLAINGAQFASARRQPHNNDHALPWDRDGSSVPPPLGHLMFWKHYRRVPLFAGFVLMVLLGTIALDSASDSTDRLAFVTTLEARLWPLAILWFAVAGVLNLLLLAAPWHARRKIARIDAFDIAAAERRVKQGAPFRRSRQ